MSEQKEGGCCGGGEVKKSCGCGCCCKVKKIVLALLVVGLSFAAGVMYAKFCPLAKSTVCPMGGK